MTRNRKMVRDGACGGVLVVAAVGFVVFSASGDKVGEPPPGNPRRVTASALVVNAELATDVAAVAEQALPPWPVATGTLAGTKAAPVVAGTSIAVVERYFADLPAHGGANDTDRQSKLIAAGEVVLFEAETPVESIRHPLGRFAILRPTDGPHKGKLLVARDVDVQPTC